MATFLLTDPEHKSITELEYRKAIQTGKSCLLFLLAKDVPWPPTEMDAVTGEGKRGKYISALRRELAQGKVVCFFNTPEKLAGLVSNTFQIRGKENKSRQKGSLSDRLQRESIHVAEQKGSRRYVESTLS